MVHFIICPIKAKILTMHDKSLCQEMKAIHIGVKLLSHFLIFICTWYQNIWQCGHYIWHHCLQCPAFHKQNLQSNFFMYSKASYSTASYSTDLDIARFLIGSKITQTARFLVFFTSIARFFCLLNWWITLLIEKK